jgi:hypothetical protein
MSIARSRHPLMIIKSWLKIYGPFIFLILITIGWVVLLRHISPDEMVQRIGVQNTYLVAFLMAVICGFSSFTGSTFYIAIGALSHGGANFLLLGLAGGIGLCISDYAFYYVVTKGKHVLDRHWKGLSKWIETKIEKAPQWVMNLFVFVYSGFFPVPNDVMTVTLAVGGTPFRKIAPYLFAGDIVSTVLLAYLSR